MLREAKNAVYVEGILSEIHANYGSRVANGKTIDYISGKIIVRVEHIVNGAPVTSEVPINIYANKFKKGTNDLNKLYLGFETVINEFKSIAAVGLEQADAVRISGASLQQNVFYNTNGQEFNTTQIRANFIKRVPRSNLKPQVNFVAEIFFAGHRDIEDEEGMPSGKIEITGVVPIYGGRIEVHKFTTSNPDVVDFFTSTVQKYDTLQVNGQGVFTSEEIARTIPVAVGEAPVRTYTKRHQEFLIEYCSFPYDDDLAFDVDEIAAAKAVYEARLAEKKQKDMNRQASKVTPAPSQAVSGKDLGF